MIIKYINYEGSYNTSKSEDLEKLLKHIAYFEKNECEEELSNIKELIEKENSVSNEDIVLYERIIDNKAEVKDFHCRYFRGSRKYTETTRFTFVKGIFFVLPEVEKEKYLVYSLIDKLIYENFRNNWSKEPCLSLRRAINKFLPGTINKSKSYFEEILEEKEIEKSTYFGDYLSDDSDSEEEENFKKLEKKVRKKKITKSISFRSNADYPKYLERMTGEDEPPPPNLKKRPTIPREEEYTSRRRRVNADLKRINDRYKSGEPLTKTFLDSLETTFVVAQYRGIHYLTPNWDKATRRSHRELNEIGKPQFSSSVIRKCGINSYPEYLEKISSPDTVENAESDEGESTLSAQTQQEEQRDNLLVASPSNQCEKQLLETAKNLEGLLLLMSNTPPVCWKGYAYLNLFLLMQYWYSSDYNNFPEKLKKDRQKGEDSYFKRFTLNSDRPLLSTGDVPYHSLKYAYGLKLYKGHEPERLRPRWRKDGRAERPYSGKVYVSLHPLTDYSEKKPSHLTSFFKQGLAPLTNLIAPERESSFLAYMAPNRVVFQHIAKYPSFAGDYKNIYEYKYGITEKMYEKLQEAFDKFPPHSDARRRLIQVLGEYLCSYHEVRLVAKAKNKARHLNKDLAYDNNLKEGAILIYRDEDGGFSLYHPETPTTANKRLGKLVEAKRELYRELATHQAYKITEYDPAFFENEKKKVEYIQQYLRKLINDERSLSVLKALSLDKLKLLKNNKDLFRLVKQDLVSIKDISKNDIDIIQEILAYDNLEKPLGGDYTFKDLINYYQENPLHVECLTAEDIAKVVLKYVPKVPVLVIKYAYNEDVDFDDISQQIANKKDRKVFEDIVEKFFSRLSSRLTPA